MTGDLVDFDPIYAPLVARKLADLPARDGVIAILGNHDYYAGGDRVTAALRAAGIDVMRNSGKVVRPGDGGGFALLGVDDVSCRTARRARTSPRPRPRRSRAGPPPDPPLAPAGHGGSAGRVGSPRSSAATRTAARSTPGSLLLGLLMKYVAGAYAVGGTTLYVNRGFGTVGAPSRIGAPPEVTRFVLVAA